MAEATPIADAAEALVVLWAVADEEELRDQAFHIPSFMRHIFPR